jgi:REP element-mobilizing transposase RayT
MTRRRFEGYPLRQLQTHGHGRAVRLGDLTYSEDVPIHLTLCAVGGKPFAKESVARMVCDSVETCSKILRYELFGYCLMPDHLHVLLSPAGSGMAIDGWLQRFKSYTGHEFVRLGGDPPLWQRSAHDHVCREDETVERVLRYIAGNPVRAELVDRWEEWRWTRLFVDI